MIHRTTLVAICLLLAACVRVDPVAELAAARADFDAGDLQTARVRVSNVLQSQPDNVDAWLLRGRLATAFGDYPGAIADFERARSLGASAGSLAVPYADAAVRIGETVRATAVLDAADLEDNPEYWLMRAAVAIRSAAAERASAALDRAAAIGASDAHYLMLRGELALLGGSTSLAEEYLRAATARDGSSGDAHAALADLLARTNRLPDSAIAFRNAADLFEDQGRSLREVGALLSLVQVHIALNDVAAAAAAAERLARLAPGAALSAFARGLVDYRKGNFDAAAASLQTAISLVPDNPQFLALLGAVHLARGNLGQAEQQLLRVLRANPGDPAASKLLAETRLRQQRPDAALEALRPLAESGVDDPQIGLLTGLASVRAGNVEQGIVYLEQAAVLDPGNLLLKVELAKAYVAVGRADEAASVLDAGLGVDSTTGAFEARLLQLLLLARSGNTEEGERAVAALMSEHSGDPRAFIVAATYRQSINESRQARELLERAVGANEEYVPARLLLAAALTQEGRVADAEAHIERALESEPRNLQALAGLAQLLLMRGATADAVDKLLQAVEDPQAVIPRLILAQVYIGQQRFDEARSYLNQATRSAPDNPEVAAVVGALALAEGRVEEAVRRLEAAASRLPNRLGIALALADAHMRNGNPEVAREILQSMLVRVPQSLPLRMALGTVELRTGATDEALRIAKALQAEFPAQRHGYMLEARVETAKRRYDEAAAVLRRAYQQDSSREVMAELVAALQLANKVPEAVDVLSKWVAEQPADVQGRLLLGGVLQNAGQGESALVQYEAVLARDESNVMALNNAAWLLQDLGQPARGLPLAERAAELAPENPAVLDTLGTILLRQNRDGDAIGHLQKAAQLAPESLEARYHLAQAQARLGWREEAKATLEALLADDQPFDQRAAALALFNTM